MHYVVKINIFFNRLSSHPLENIKRSFTSRYLDGGNCNRNCDFGIRLSIRGGLNRIYKLIRIAHSEQGKHICPTLIFIISHTLVPALSGHYWVGKMCPITHVLITHELVYTIADWLKMRLGTNRLPLLSTRYTLQI